MQKLNKKAEKIIFSPICRNLLFLTQIIQQNILEDKKKVKRKKSLRNMQIF